jgi:E3 ubiquitin-protein ligase CCNP1IP1
MLIDQDNLRRKNEELGHAFREKSRKHAQTQELYDKLKRRAMLGQVQSAASDAVDFTIQSSAISSRFKDPSENMNHIPRPRSLFSNMQGNTMQQSHLGPGEGDIPSMPPPVVRGGLSDSWNGYSSQESNNRMF